MGSKKKVARLFLDLNCCIHGCKNRMLKDISDDEPVPEDFEDRIIQEVIRTIMRFCSETSPTDLLWIAVDGVVPLAKMRQQRERRMNAIHSREIITEIHEKYSRSQKAYWDSNAITPGTPFMLKLCDVIRKQLPTIKTKAGVKHIEMDGVRNPGEGEQKIFAYARKFPNNDPETEDVVYGLDADLIILSILQSQIQKASISLLREQQEFGKLVQNASGDDELIRFKVSDFAQVVPYEWGGPKDANNLKDYVVLMSLMGNDFVPHIPSLTFRSDGVERILDAYSKVNRRVVNEDDSICWETLRNIFNVLKTLEMDIMKRDEEIALKIRERILSGQVPFRHAIVEDPMEQEILALDWEHIRKANVIKPGESGWETRYYKKMVMGVWSSKKKIVNRVVQEYIKSIQWCWEYYRGRFVEGDWYYVYTSGPLLKDLTSFTPPPTMTFTSGVSLTMGDIPASAQLICVLPPASHKSLSGSGRAIASKCPDLYPIDHDKWSYNKRHAWECESFLPIIPIKRITKYISTS